MGTLLEYQDPLLLTQRQPVSLAALGNLQARALEGDARSDELLKRHIVALGFFLAQKLIENKGLDRDYVLGNISVESLMDLSYVRSFTEWGDSNMHVRFIQKYLEEVIEQYLYDTVNENLMLRRKDYLYISEVRAGMLAISGREPAPEDLAEESGFPQEIVLFVQQKELEKQIADLKRNLEKVQVLRIREFIRHSKNARLSGDLKGIRPFERKLLCYYFGIDDGEQKTFRQVADHFGISEERAEETIRKHIIFLVEPACDDSFEGNLMK